MKHPIQNSAYNRILSRFKELDARRHARESRLSSVVDRTCREIDLLIQECRSGFGRRCSRGPNQWKELRQSLRALRDWLRWNQIPDLLAAR